MASRTRWLVLSYLQIFVEIERARLTRRLAAIREAEGNIADAADTMQEVPVVSAGLSRLGPTAAYTLCVIESRHPPLLFCYAWL